MSAYIGQVLFVPVGKQVNRNGTVVRQKRGTTITVTDVKPDRRGKTRVFWKSGGYPASALI